MQEDLPVKQKILIIDDEPAICGIVARLLQRAGYATAETTDATQALRMLRGGQRYDVILCDLMMPDVSGLGVYEALHEAGVRRYGFHGLSYEFVATALPALDPTAARGRTVAPVGQITIRAGQVFNYGRHAFGELRVLGRLGFLQIGAEDGAQTVASLSWIA